MSRTRNTALMITVGYLAASALWILISDRVVSLPLHQTKGLLFVAVSGALLYIVLSYTYKSVATFHAFVETTPVGVLGLDRQGRVILWNPAAEEAFGWKKNEVLGQSVMPELASESHGEAIARVLHGETLKRAIVTARRKDGSRIEVSLHTTPFLSAGNQTGVIAIMEDVTELRRLEATSQRHMVLLENTPEIVLVYRPDGRITDANPAACQSYGYPLAELTALSIADLRAPETPAPAPGTVGRFESLHRRRDGFCFPVEVNASAARVGDETFYISLVRDVTAQKRREGSLALENGIHQLVLRNEPLDKVLDHLCAGLAALYQCDLVWIGSKESDGCIDPIAASGNAMAMLSRSFLRWDQPPEHSGPTGRAIQTGLPQSGTFPEPPVSAWEQLAEKLQLRAYLSLPLTVREEIIGSLTLFSPNRDTFDDETVASLHAFAGQVALSIVSARAASQLLLQNVALESAANAVVITDVEGTILWVNPAFTQVTGYTAQEAIGQNPRVLKSGYHHNAFYVSLWETIRAGMVWQGELHNRKKDGSIYMEEMTVTPVRVDSDRITHFIAVKQDISDRKRQAEAIEHLTKHDPLTDLPNRRALEECLEVALLRAKQGATSRLMVLDIDHFKMVNEAFGYAAGDQLLVSVARHLTEVVGVKGVVARIGPDQFAVLVDNLSADQAARLPEEIRQSMEGLRIQVNGASLECTVCIGVVPVNGTQDREAALALAESACFAAKDQGPNRVVRLQSPAPPESAEHAPCHTAICILEALRSGGFCLHYQPIVRLATGATEYYEVLLRMTAPDGSLLSAGAFLPAAERYRLMPQIDRWVVERVLTELERHPGLRLFVNMSGQSLGDLELRAHLESLITLAGIQVAERLTLEVTETVAVRDLGQTRQWMRRLADLGCRFALDDFGSGFSSFSYLQTLPAHFLKIDGTFVRNLQSDHTNRALVRSMASVSRALDKMAVAEWVESPEVARILVDLGIEYGQGYGLGRPSPTLPDA